MTFKEFRQKTMPLRKTYPWRHPFFRAWVIYGMQQPASPFSYVLSKIGITANQISVLRVLICFSILPLFLLSNILIILGLVAFYFALITDCIDGQLARFHETSSLEGSFVDSLTSAVMFPCIYIATGLTAYNWSDDVWGLLLVCFILGFKGLSGKSKNATIVKLLFSQNTTLSVEDRSAKDKDLRMRVKSHGGHDYPRGFKYIILLLLNDNHFLVLRLAASVGLGIIMANNAIIIYLLLSGSLFLVIRSEVISSLTTYKDKQVTKAVNAYL